MMTRIEAFLSDRNRRVATIAVMVVAVGATAAFSYHSARGSGPAASVASAGGASAAGGSAPTGLGPKSSDTNGSASTATASASATTSTSGPAGTTAPATKLIDVRPVDAAYRPLPGLTVTTRKDATCAAGSDVAGSTYRCVAGHSIYDPCWTDLASPTTPSVICQLRPWSTSVTRLLVTTGGLSPFNPGGSINRAVPLGIQLADGVRCLAVQGAHDEVLGHEADYGCSQSKVVPLGLPQRSTALWTIDTAESTGGGHYRAGPAMSIVDAWYAVPDAGSQLSASEHACTGSALAFSAAQHEGGAPAQMTLLEHACRAGYALGLVDYDGHGWDVQFLFHATTSGWRVLVVADKVEPGHFGSAAATIKRLQATLKSSPRDEAIAF